MTDDEYAILKVLVQKYGPKAVASACWHVTKPRPLRKRYADDVPLADIPTQKNSKARSFLKYHSGYDGFTTAGDLYAIPAEEWAERWYNLGEKGAEQLRRVMFVHEGDDDE